MVRHTTLVRNAPMNAPSGRVMTPLSMSGNAHALELPHGRPICGYDFRRIKSVDNVI